MVSTGPAQGKEPQTVLQGITEQLDQISSQVQASTGRIRNIVGRILNPPPVAERGLPERESRATIPGKSGSIGTILNQLEQLRQLQSQQSQEIDQLETL